MARIAGKLLMLGDIVRESAEISVGNAGREFRRRFGGGDGYRRRVLRTLQAADRDEREAARDQ